VLGGGVQAVMTRRNFRRAAVVNGAVHGAEA